MNKVLSNIGVTLLVIVLSPCIVLFCVTALICWPFGALWKHYFPPPQRETSVGLLIKSRLGWHSPWNTFPGFQVKDREGEPDPEFLSRLPTILEDVPRIHVLAMEAPIFQEATRGAEDPLELISIWQGAAPDREFTLLFGEPGAEEQDCVGIAVFEGRIVEIKFL